MLAKLSLTVTLAFTATAQQPTPLPPSSQVLVNSESTPAPHSNQDIFPKPLITNPERNAILVLSDDLDLHLTPAESRAEAHAILTLQNTSPHPIERVPLQLTSTLRWLSVTSLTKHQSVTFTQSPITTDADHTGYAQEAVVQLEHPLAPDASLLLSVNYAGTIAQSTDRLTLIGTPTVKAAEADWDGILPTSDDSSTALRGFGEVLWYPTAAPTAVFNEGNQLVTTVVHQRLLNIATTMRLRLTVLYSGDPPDAAIFNTRIQSLVHLPDETQQVIDNTHGVATAEFPFAPIGFRTPNLFLTAQHATTTPSPLLTAITPTPEAVEPYATAADSLAPLLHDYLGPTPITTLTLLEHPGNPFEDHAFIAAHLSITAPPEGIAPEIIRGLAHAFFQTNSSVSLWLDQGIPEFMSLLATERTSGRPAAIAQLQQDALALLFAEPDLVAHPNLAGTPLIQASSDSLLHLKSAAVLWQLREILGDDLFRLGLTTFRHSRQLNPALDRDPEAFEKSLEKTCSHDLAWFFDDWVYHDRSLPDLTIAQVNPRPILPMAGHPGGYLVAIDIRNDGYAAAEVPVTVRAGNGGSADTTATSRIRVPARSTASVRIVFGGVPETVELNDGSVPELRAPTHTFNIHIK
jgi:hypothetical protein